MRNASLFAGQLGVVAAAMLFALPGSAQAGRSSSLSSSIVPAKEGCPSDIHGIIFFKVGTHVFKQPGANLISIRGPEAIAGNTANLRDENADACASRPLQGTGFRFTQITPVAETDSADHSSRSTSNSGGFISVVADPDKSHYGTNPSDVQLYDQLLGSDGDCSASPDGLSECRSSGRIGPNPSLIMLKASQSAYATSDKTFPFSGSCRPLDLSGLASDYRCEVSYKLLPTVNVAYVLSTGVIPFDRILSFDRLLRQNLLSSETMTHD